MCSVMSDCVTPWTVTHQTPLSMEFPRPEYKNGLPFPSPLYWGSAVKNPSANAEYSGLIPRSGRSPGKGNGNPLRYSCLGNSMDRGVWWATVHGVSKSRTILSLCTHAHTRRANQYRPIADASPVSVKWGPNIPEASSSPNVTWLWITNGELLTWNTSLCGQ